MRKACFQSRRAAALLLVLATLVLAIAASATAVRLATTARLNRTFTQRTLIADDLLRALEAPILAWLASESADVVLPPDTTSPMVSVLHDSWVDQGMESELRVTAWDQCGMVPIEAARSGSPLRSSLTAETTSALDKVRFDTAEPPGLDLFLIARSEGDPRVFPVAAGEPAVVFRSEMAPPEDEAVSVDALADAHTPAVGAMIATHNPKVINVNTAPINLVEAALRLAGRGGLESIVEARSEGRLFPLGHLTRSTRRDSAAPAIVARSNAWAFRIDIRVGPLQRSWWSIYVNQRGNRWECAQRLAIPE